MLDSFLRFVQGRVLDECVALFCATQLVNRMELYWATCACDTAAHVASSQSSTHFHVTSPAVEVHVQVLDLAVFAKQILNVLLTGFLVDVRRDNDPALDAAYSGCVLGGAGVAGV